MVLALRALEAFDRRRAERDQKLRDEGEAKGEAQVLALVTALVEELGVEQARALIQRVNSERRPGETSEQAIQRLRSES